ncbi:MAG TPA: hypothetical protein VEU33_34680 [Archangium sp.]|nr:hypothetical protein [Archangium sp.]
MTHKTLHIPLGVLLAGLVLAACGGVPDAGQEPLDEGQTGRREAALCSGLSVTDLTLNGISTFQGEMAGNGAWTVSTSSNAARLEFYVDGALRSVSEEVGTPNATGTISGSWYFSATGVACGTHTFEVRAWPMVISSSGSRTTCYENAPRVITRSVTEACPEPPISWHNCVRKTSTTVQCTGGAQGGTAPYTAYWKVGHSGRWFAGSMIQTFTYALNTPYYFQVKDAAGTLVGGEFCMCSTTSCNICS